MVLTVWVSPVVSPLTRTPLPYLPPPAPPHPNRRQVVHQLFAHVVVPELQEPGWESLSQGCMLSPFSPGGGNQMSQVVMGSSLASWAATPGVSLSSPAGSSLGS